MQFWNTISNDVHDTYNTLGVEAARELLFRELQKYYPLTDRILPTVIPAIADWMTWGGNIVATTRHGVVQMDESSPMKGCTFEQPVEVFYNAAFEGTTDHLKGISEQLMREEQQRLEPTLETYSRMR